MRILTVTHFFEQHGGGIERVAGHLCRAFRDQGHDVAWAASSTPCALEGIGATSMPSWNGIERVTGLPMPIPGLSAIQRLWRAVGASDAVVIHDALYVTSMIGMIAARLRRKPVLLIQHVGELPFRNRLLRGCIAIANSLVGRTMLATADQAIFISAITQAYFRKVPFRAPPILLFNGVDDRVFYPDVVRVEQAGARRILFVGRFVEKKGLATIGALARLRPDLSFVLAGQGPIDVASWGLSNVQVVQGLSGPMLADLYREADILLLPSVGEGFPLVIQEAMACGLPVICGAQSARADPAAASFLVPVTIDPGQPEHNADLVSAAIDGLGMTKSDRLAMVRYAHSHYRWTVMANTIIKLIEVVPQAMSAATPVVATE